MRHGKASIYEGGTRVPMFVIWPGVVEPNSICQDFISSVDIYPTILDMLGISVPGNIEFDGLSIIPSLEGGKIDRKALFTFKPFGALNENPAVSVRRGKYKLIRFFHSASDQSHIYELYDLDNDISETNNLAEKMPYLVKELDGMIDRYLMETDAVVPIPNPDYHE